MKAVFIAFDQAHIEDIMFILDRYNCRGFSRWDGISGRGSKSGEPHYGSHSWPSTNSAIITIVDEEVLNPLLSSIKVLDEKRPKLGLRAFVWNIEKSI
ncbi:MAG: hypothetical protein RR293_04030 [Bacteroidales bacterium]